MMTVMQALVVGWMALQSADGAIGGPWMRFAGIAAAQRTVLSPHEKLTKTVAGATITIDYGRPSMRGRKIFGGLVPYGRVWCPGADAATTFDSTQPVLIGNTIVPPGPHTVWILPTADRWTLILSKDPSGFHTNYHPDRDLVRVELSKRTLPAPVEKLTFDVVAAGGPGAGTLLMSWENLEVSVPFHVTVPRR